MLDPRRDLDAECGHPVEVKKEDYKLAFLRGDIAARVVKLFPEESWSESPGIFENEDESETEFEKKWVELEDRLRLFSMLQRVDIMSGIGRFGILLLGIDDGAPLNMPAPGINEKGERSGTPKANLLYLRVFDESLVVVKDLEQDVANPRYGLPTKYEVTFADVEGQKTTGSQSVHWSRVIHVADNRTCSEIYGQPRMELVFNRLLDVKKIAGGSGEMFWKGGFPGLSLESMPQTGEEIEFDKESAKQQLEAYMNGLQRYIATVGMQTKSLSVQVADPGPHLEVQLRLIAAAMGVPWRVFIGSEAAQLASEQDTRAWNKRIGRRREEYLNPFVISPFIDRLVAFGTLPEPKEVIITWPDLNSPSNLDKASIAEKQSNAMAKYVQAGADLLIPPFFYLTQILGLKDDVARSILDEAKGEIRLVDPPAPAPAARGNGAPARA